MRCGPLLSWCARKRQMDPPFPGPKEFSQSRGDAGGTLVALAYQHPSGDRYVALGGRATIVEDVAEMRTMWSSDLDAHFPPGFADANMIERSVLGRMAIYSGLVRRRASDPFQGAPKSPLRGNPEKISASHAGPQLAADAAAVLFEQDSA